MNLVGSVHIAAGGPEMIPHVLARLAAEGMRTEANPDIYLRSYASFGIDEAREIRDRSLSRAVGDRRAFILTMPGMTNEAQNALLKTLEEPAGESFFFIIIPAPEMLLPTLRSRAQMFIADPALAVRTPASAEHPDAEQFLGAPPEKRLDMLKPLLEKGDDDKRDIFSIIMFLSSLERILGSRVREEGARRGLQALYRARAYLGDKGALVKPLLEQVALLVPRL